MQDKIDQFNKLREKIIYFAGIYPIDKRKVAIFDKWSLKDVLAHLSNWVVHDIDCLEALKEGREPYWEPDVDEFNARGIEERKDKSWNEVFDEFSNLSKKLVEIYETLPNDLWERDIWKGRGQTAKRFLHEDIEHWRNEHLTEIIHKSLDDEDWISPSAEIKQSQIGGKGLFATEPIKKGDLVVVWGGTYVGAKEAKKAGEDGKLVMQWDDNLFSVEDRGEGSGYFVNHSCEPNLYMQGAYALIAMRDIAKGEELTADYAIWEADEYYVSKWDCNCGSANCRKKLTGKDWKLLELQERYKGHFSPLINNRILRDG